MTKREPRWAAVVGLALVTAAACNRARHQGTAPSASGAGAAPDPAAACTDADPKACFERAQALDFGKGGQKLDKEAAFRGYEAACTRGVADACTAMAEVVFVGDGKLPADKVKARTLFEKACEAKSGRGCVTLGVLTAMGSGGLTADEAKAKVLLERGLAIQSAQCTAGDVSVCYTVASSYGDGIVGLMADAAKATQWYKTALEAGKKACEAANAAACNVAGIIEYLGSAGPVDKASAVHFYQRGCDAHDADSCATLGFAYEHGDGGLAKDLAKARALYTEACKLGNGRGCYNLGTSWDREGPERDQVKAVAALRDGCDRRWAPACNDLGYAYQHAEGGLTRDKPQALALYTKACDGGNALGCKNAKRLGESVERDKVATDFRSTLKVGSDSHCGLVIEVKPPIARVQSMIGEVWLKIEQLFPQGKQDCRFVNGVYQDPG
jgi:TPR repeat protein